MELVPVIDLMNGQVIRGVAGQRQNYRRNDSRLTQSADPKETALALAQAFQPGWIYVADLDAIQGGPVQTGALRLLLQTGVKLAVDAGVSNATAALKLVELGIGKVIVGLETLPNLEVLGEILEACGPEKVCFSLDLRDGNPLGPAGAGQYGLQLVADAMHMKLSHLIVLELSNIGLGRGVSTGALCHSIKVRWPELVVWTGGGVRSLPDLHRLQLLRVDGVMVASALHDGGITPADWQAFEALDVDSTLLAMDA
jgi:phosphoribosylformimino-5-aminoimidazole carboxamide ribotide isomerase